MTFNVVMPIFPKVTQLDFTGPAQFFAYAPDTKVHVVAATRDPIETDSGFSVCASTTFEACPSADLLCIPGGPGVFDAIGDETLLAFVRQQASAAKYVTSVCTGMFILGAIGVLEGKRVTSHWGYTGAIAACGAIYTPGRVVLDGKIMTAGGVTAGLDYGMTAIAKVFGEEAARKVQLQLEYDPAPPFDSGHPSTASVHTLDSVREFYAEATGRMNAALATANSSDPSRPAFLQLRRHGASPYSTTSQCRRSTLQCSKHEASSRRHNADGVGSVIPAISHPSRAQIASRRDDLGTVEAHVGVRRHGEVRPQTGLRRQLRREYLASRPDCMLRRAAPAWAEAAQGGLSVRVGG